MSDSASDALTCENKGQAQHSGIIKLHRTPSGVADTFKHDLDLGSCVCATLNVFFFLSHSP